jgi:glycosyltransferase involved in cell wall biosynthesis
VVLDNCSTDHTVDLVRQFATRLPIQLLQRPENIGSLRNFNEALDIASTTDFLHLVSHDDVLEPQFFARLLPLVANSPGRALAFSKFVEIDQTGAITRPYRGTTSPQPRVLSQREFLIRQAELNHVYLQTALFKTDRQPAPVHFRDHWQQAADVLFFAEHAPHCRLLVELPEPLVRFRIHPTSATGTNTGKLNAFVLEEWRAMNEIAKLIPEGPATRWLRHQKLRCIFAARTQVKIQRLQGKSPAFADEISRAGKKIAGPLCWPLGKVAVTLRDFRQPR